MNKTNLIFVAGLMLGCGLWAWAGSLEPTAPPSPTMVTLEAMDAKLTATLQGNTANFVGLTTQMFDGGVGWHVLTGACFAEFPGARVAFSDEYIFTVNPPSISTEAWVHPRPSIPFSSSNGFFDAAGQGFSGAVNCIFWTDGSLSATGSVIAPNGRIDIGTCDIPRPVACALP